MAEQQDVTALPPGQGTLYPPPSPVYPYSGVCANCRRERTDLFWHRFDEAFYCADVLRCEARLQVQIEPAERYGSTAPPLSARPEAVVEADRLTRP